MVLCKLIDATSISQGDKKIWIWGVFKLFAVKKKETTRNDILVSTILKLNDFKNEG